MKNQKVFVMGHKYPDTDSICSAIAYADIKNRTTQTKRYIPRRAGQINEETQYVLNRFGVQPPAYLGNIGTQVKDMDIRPKPDADRTMSLKNAWDMMQNKGIVTLPICNSDDELEGIVTIGDIADIYMDTKDSYLLANARAQYNKIKDTLDGEIVEGLASIDESAITGESAPVIREAGGDKSSVTGGTKVLSDTIWLFLETVKKIS